MIVTAGYIKEISDHGWISEVLAERYGDLLTLLRAHAPRSVVYGGAIRDSISGLIAEDGDLDVSMHPSEFSNLYSIMRKDPKWLHTSEKAEDRYSHTDIETVKTFTGTAGQRVQLIGCKSENIIKVAHDVDIICCGMFMLEDGRIYEAVKDAFEDCSNRILRINAASKVINHEHTRARIEKLVKRGWIDKIDYKLLDGMPKTKEGKLSRRLFSKSSKKREEEKPVFNFGKEVDAEFVVANTDYVPEPLAYVNPTYDSPDGGYAMAAQPTAKLKDKTHHKWASPEATQWASPEATPSPMKAYPTKDYGVHTITINRDALSAPYGGFEVHAKEYMGHSEDGPVLEGHPVLRMGDSGNLTTGISSGGRISASGVMTGRVCSDKPNMTYKKIDVSGITAKLKVQNEDDIVF